MRLAIFTDGQSCGRLKELFGRPEIAVQIKSTVFYMTYDDFIKEVPNSGCNSVIVAHKGATGMQAARAAKILLHRVPIIWFSDDGGFVEESYRIGCAYFSPDTVNEKILSTALGRCK